jgi:HK97 family phage prohead protease
LHDQDNVDLDFAQSGRAPVFTDHEPKISSQVGVVETANLDTTNRSLSTNVRLLKDDPLADRVYNGIKQKIFNNVSVGVRILSEHLDENTDEKEQPHFIVDKWRLNEISIVGIPAIKQGIGIITAFSQNNMEIETMEPTIEQTQAEDIQIEMGSDFSLADERKQLRELNKSLSKEKVLKLVDAKGKDREKCTLGLFEGDSAMSFFRKFRDPSFQGAFPLRGKFINVTELPNTRVIQNQEVKDLLTAIGLKMGEPPKDLRYGKILIYSDADVDGDSIAGLLMNFFGRYWPELFEQERICRVMTPLVVAKRKGETLPFYSAADFDEWQRKQKDLTKWDIAYKKGLAALEDEEAKEIIVNPKMFSIAGGSGLKPTLDAWFASDPAIRKLKILGEPTESSEDNT